MSNALHQPQQPIQYDPPLPPLPRYILLGWFRRESGPIIRCDNCFERPGWIRYDDFRPPIMLAGLAGVDKVQRGLQIHRNYAQVQHEYGAKSYRTRLCCLTCATSQVERILPQVGALERAVQALQGTDQAGVALFMDMQALNKVLFVSRARTTAKLFREMEIAERRNISVR